MKIFTVLILIILLTSVNAQNFWEQTNGPYGGYIQHVVTGPNGSVFVWNEFNGMYHSSDNGENWVKVDLSCYTYDLAFINNDIYAGTSEGIFHSSDNGQTWSQIGLKNNLIESVGINSKGYIFAGGSSLEPVESPSYDNVVFVSTDNGNNWAKKTEGLTSQTLTKLLVAPDDNIYVGTLDASNAGCVYVSTNNGDSWSPAGSTGNVRSLSSDANGNIYAGTQHGLCYYNKSKWIYLNEFNNSEIYTQVSSTGKVFALVDHQGIYYLPAKSDSIQYLNKWKCITSNLEKVFNTFSINQNGTIFAGTSSGIFTTTNSGYEWNERNNGLIYSTINSLCIIPDPSVSSNKKIFAGTSGGLFSSTNNGNDWLKISIGLTNISFQTIITDTIKPGYLFAVNNWANYPDSPDKINNSGIYRSTDYGITWQKKDSGIVDTIITSLACNSSGIIFAGAERGIYCSTDDGETWNLINNNLSWYWVHCVALNSNNHIFAENDGKLYRSTDNGNNWSEMNINIDPYISSIIINSKGYIFLSSVHGYIYRSIDNGNSWELKNNGTSSPVIRCMAVDKNDVLFAGTSESGIFYSTNDGENWNNINNGLTDLDVNTFAVDPDGHIFAGTLSSGVFRSIYSATSIQDIDKTSQKLFSLKQNYPNPFNPVTTISYTLPEAANVKVEIYNVIGQKIATLVNETETAGNYEVQWNAQSVNNTSSGVYLCKIHAEGNKLYTKTIKLMQMK